MRYSRQILAGSMLLLLLGVLPAARAQERGAEHAKRVAAEMEKLAHGTEDEQGTALYQLAQLSLPPAQGIPLFQAHLQRRTKTLAEALIIAHALEGLTQYGTAARPALPDLICLLEETGTVEGEAADGRQTWWWLTTALSKIGPDDPATIEALKSTFRRCLENPERLSPLLTETAQALSQMGPAAHTAVPLLTQALSRSPQFTSDLATALSHMMPEAGLAIPALIRALEADQSPETVVEALGTMGPAAKAALPALHRTLELPSPKLAAGAFTAIAQIAGQPALTLPQALTALQQIDRRPLPTLYAAFATVQRQGTKAQAAIPLLTQIIEQRKELWLRRMAIETLAVVGPGEDRDAALTLIRAVQHRDPAITLEFEKAFAAFGGAAKQVVPELSILLQADDVRLRDHVLTLLSSIGSKAAPAVPYLIRMLQPEGHAGRAGMPLSQILWVLDRIGPEAQEAAPVLTDLLLASEKNDRGIPLYDPASMLFTLMQIGITPRVLPTVREMLKSDYPTEVACAAHAVALLAAQNVEASKDTFPLLLRPLQADYKDSDMTSGFFHGYVFETSARIESMRALARLGSAAREALPLLQTYADREDLPLENLPYRPPSLKGEARRAIQTIQQAKQPN